MGLEPTADFNLTGILPCGCVICEECRAALALQMARSEWLDLAPVDAGLQRVIAVWDRLPDAIRLAIAALVECQK